MDIQTYHVLAFIHLISLVVGFGAVIVVDTFGLLWVLKKIKLETVNQTANITQRLIWLGWLGLVASGTALVVMRGSVSHITMIKIFFVAMLGVNGIFLHLIKKNFDKLVSLETVPLIYKFRIGLTSVISQLGWWGAIVIGFLNTKFRGQIPQPENPWLYMVGIVLVFGIIFMLGETFIKKNND